MTLTTLPRSSLTKDMSGWQGGDGPALILIHGVGLNADAWNEMLPFLQEHFSVTVVDMPGHGESVAFSADYQPTLQDYSQRIRGVLETLKDPAVVMGHSMGALISLDLASRNSELVTAVIPLNAIFRRTQNAAKLVRERASKLSADSIANPSSTLERWFGQAPNGAMKTMSEQCGCWLTNVDPVGYRHAYTVFAEEDGPGEIDLKQLQCPALFITGEDEPNSTPAMSRAMANLVHQGTCEIVSGARHMMTMTHAEVVAELVVDFCRNLGSEDRGV